MRHAEFHPRHSLLGAGVSDPRMALSDFLKEHGQKKKQKDITTASKASGPAI